MGISFGALEERANAAVFRALANASMALPGQADMVRVVFDAANGQEDDMGVQTLQPALRLRPALAACVGEGDVLSIVTDAQPQHDGTYTVRSVTPRAEGGIARVMLARCAT